MDAAGGISIDAAGASNLTTSSGALTLEGAGGVDIGATGVATTIKGTFNVDEAASFDTTLTVTGTTTLNDDVTIAAGKALTVGNGATTMGGTLGAVSYTHLTLPTK